MTARSSRWLAMALGAVAGVIVTGAAALWLRPSDVRDPAHRFLDAVAAGSLARAADELHETFREEVPQDALRAFLQRSGIEAPATVSVNGHCVRGDSGQVHAQLSRDGSAPVAVELGLVSEGGAWTVASVRARPASGAGATGSFGPPTVAEMQALIRLTTRRFADAVAAGDLTLFRRTTARAFRERFSADEFEQAFGGFIEQQVNLAALERFEPVFDPPAALDEGGVLVLEGHFPTRPSQVSFRYEFGYRHIGWELVGIDLAVRPVG